MKAIIFDIETAPLPREQLEKIMPKFEAPSNYKDPQKIETAINEKMYEWIANAALSATTGSVCAIGMKIIDEGTTVKEILLGDEVEILTKFWGLIAPKNVIWAKLIGFNSNSFDFPFLVRRSLKLGVAVPPTLLTRARGRIYLSEYCYDLMDYWACGTRETISLDNLSKFFGVGAKNGNGAFFHKLLEENPKLAKEYLSNDLDLTEACARKMGVL